MRLNQIVWIGISCAICLSRVLPAEASEPRSILANIYDASEAIVYILAENAAGFGGKKTFLDPKTGRVVTVGRISPFHYSRNGAGVIIDPSGLIATNAHTVMDAGRVTVTLHDDTKVKADVVEASREDDIALLKIIPPYELRALKLADSDALRPGNRVYSVGSSKIKRNSISEGHIKALGSRSGSGQIDAIQINFDIYEGDSGSPIFNEWGELVGLVNAKLRTRHFRSFAVPANIIKNYYRTQLNKPPDDVIYATLEIESSGT